MSTHPRTVDGIDVSGLTFRQRAELAIARGATDEHGNSRIEFVDGGYATFVHGKTWAHWPSPGRRTSGDPVPQETA